MNNFCYCTLLLLLLTVVDFYDICMIFCASVFNDNAVSSLVHNFCLIFDFLSLINAILFLMELMYFISVWFYSQLSVSGRCYFTKFYVFHFFLCIM